MNERFGQEFAKILERTYLSIKDNMIDPVPMQAQEEDSRALAMNQGNHSMIKQWYRFDECLRDTKLIL